MEPNTKKWIHLVKYNLDGEFMRSRDRTKVYRIPEGWLLKFHHFHGANSSMTAQSITYIPDPHHEWKPQEEQTTWERIDKKRNPNFVEYTDKIKVYKGWVYKDCFFIAKKEMHISLVYVPEQ